LHLARCSGKSGTSTCVDAICGILVALLAQVCRTRCHITKIVSP
jgi:hypothetical protein